MRTPEGSRCGAIFGLVAVLLIFTDHADTAGRTKRRRCMATKNEWRSKGFGDSQQVPSSPVSGKHNYPHSGMACACVYVLVFTLRDLFLSGVT